MADKKISALTGATTPLAGTEVLPIVQGGATVKVAVSDLTAGRAISATVLTSTVAVGTAPIVVTSTTNVANLNASSLGGATFAAPGAIGGTTASAITGTTITGTDTTEATSTTAAALKTAGGLAVAKKIYVGDNIVVVSGKGIDFADTAGTGTSELFADYEEGTWTPTGIGVTFSSATGKYTKIGRCVNIQFSATWPVTGSGNDAGISGFPFAGEGSTYGFTVGRTTHAAALNLATPGYLGTLSGLSIYASAGGAAITDAALSTAVISGSGFYFA